VVVGVKTAYGSIFHLGLSLNWRVTQCACDHKSDFPDTRTNDAIRHWTLSRRQQYRYPRQRYCVHMLMTTTKHSSIHNTISISTKKQTRRGYRCLKCKTTNAKNWVPPASIPHAEASASSSQGPQSPFSHDPKACARQKRCSGLSSLGGTQDR
jgi:hypothetical protein